MNSPNSVLVTGGAGYIGSHTLLALIDAGYTPTVLDNFSNAQPECLRRVEQLAGQAIPLIEGDVRSDADLQEAFSRCQPRAVVHFAGLKAVGESATAPLDYYATNVGGSIAVLRNMRAFDCRRLIFSSSATVYGAPQSVPVAEDAPLQPASPYGQCKAMIEQIIRDEAQADPDFRAISLRYFNPVGAHPSGCIGEDPHDTPNNLLPFIAQVAVRRRPQLLVFGQDYPTPDGTGIRDYIHVMDLARGHVAALAALAALPGAQAINLGTGRGYSVLQMRSFFAAASGRDIPYQVVERRAGDVAEYFADTRKATALLGWQAQFDAAAMCADGWRWQQANPYGYATAKEPVA